MYVELKEIHTKIIKCLHEFERNFIANYFLDKKYIGKIESRSRALCVDFNQYLAKFFWSEK